MSTPAGPRRSSRASTPTLSPPLAPASAKKSTPSARKSTRAASPAPSLVTRPALPKNARNTLLVKEGTATTASGTPATKLHKVKLQTLQLSEVASGPSTIMIARVKCPVPKGSPGHIIKRFDTQAVSASSLFRAAYPTATEAEEITEMDWITNGSKGRYGDTKAAGAESDESRKLSGTWIPVAHAKQLATEYGIARYAIDLIDYSDKPVADPVEVMDSEADSPIVAARATTKRQRVASPSALSSPTKMASISQVTSEVEIIAAKALVETMKVAAAAVDAPAVATISKKRVITSVEIEEDYPVVPLTLHDIPTVAVPDKRGFWGKLFKRAPKRVPVNGGREIKGAGAQVAVMTAEEQAEEDGITPDGRRWMAGLGLAVAVGATAAVPYLLG